MIDASHNAAWGFIENEKPQFDLVVLCPPMVYGPLQHTINNIGLMVGSGRYF